MYNLSDILQLYSELINDAIYHFNNDDYTLGYHCCKLLQEHLTRAYNNSWNWGIEIPFNIEEKEED